MADNRNALEAPADNGSLNTISPAVGESPALNGLQDPTTEATQEAKEVKAASSEFSSGTVEEGDGNETACIARTRPSGSSLIGSTEKLEENVLNEQEERESGRDTDSSEDEDELDEIQDRIDDILDKMDGIEDDMDDILDDIEDGMDDILDGMDDILDDLDDILDDMDDIEDEMDEMDETEIDRDEDEENITEIHTAAARPSTRLGPIPSL